MKAWPSHKSCNSFGIFWRFILGRKVVPMKTGLYRAGLLSLELNILLKDMFSNSSKKNIQKYHFGNTTIFFSLKWCLCEDTRFTFNFPVSIFCTFFYIISVVFWKKNLPSFYFLNVLTFILLKITFKSFLVFLEDWLNQVLKLYVCIMLCVALGLEATGKAANILRICHVLFWVLTFSQLLHIE